MTEKTKRNRKVTPADVAMRAYKHVTSLEETERKEAARHKEALSKLKKTKEATLAELKGEALNLYEALRAAGKGKSNG